MTIDYDLNTAYEEQELPGYEEWLETLDDEPFPHSEENR